MARARRQLMKLVRAELERQKARIIKTGMDGAGHQVIEFEVEGRTLHFHFATSTKLNGCTPRNMICDLRRTIRHGCRNPTSLAA